MEQDPRESPELLEEFNTPVTRKLIGPGPGSVWLSNADKAHAWATEGRLRDHLPPGEIAMDRQSGRAYCSIAAAKRIGRAYQTGKFVPREYRRTLIAVGSQHYGVLFVVVAIVALLLGVGLALAFR